ncbi:M48 family metallopeptidase [Marinicauda sp. Alg238-R41]|uniref:M48 family metallopeptidase n=1 Tax=Marinicauda sp. Alg238-R41 TaxID=2993447 RepID=UPI0022E07329|nr:SprT family zinc-dependent metalloprotease [Marinicauda sp. Alg238-R41]
MESRSIILSGRTVGYTLKRSARRRTIGFRVGSDGLCVTLPRRVAIREAESALREKSGWILSKLDKWTERASIPELTGADGESVGYLGRALTLRVVGHSRARTLIVPEANALVVHVDSGLSGSLRDATVKRALERWRRRAALELMAPRLARFAAELNRPAPAVSIRVNASRWGSCSSDGSIRMNARLIAFDEALVDYVCAHEACHLIEMNHGPRFYALLDRLMPDHRSRSAALKAAVAPGHVF